MNKRITFLLASGTVFFLILVGFIGRLYLVLKLPLWLDENFTIRLINNDFPKIALGNLDPTHPPGYYIFLKLWSQLSVHPTYLRLSSLLIFILNSILIYYLGVLVYKRNHAGTLLFIYVFSGYFLTFDWQVRMYSLLVCIILFSMVLTFQKNILLRTVLFISVNVTGALVDYGFLFYLIPFIILQFLRWVKKRKPQDGELMLTGLVSIALFTVIWMPNLIRYFKEGLKGINWLTNYMTSYFYGPFFLGSFDQFFMTSIFVTFLVFGIYLSLFTIKNSFIINLIFIASFSLIGTKFISVFFTPILHVRSLQIIGIAALFLLSSTLIYISERQKYVALLFKFMFFINFLIVIYYLPNHPGIYLISFR